MAKKNTPILITGCACSNTTFIAGVFAICGAFAGYTSQPTALRKLGTFENARLQHLHYEILKKLQCDPLGQHTLPDTNNVIEYPKFRERVEARLKTQGYPGGPWMFKDAKITLLWRLWDKAFPEAQWVLVRRDPQQIAEKCVEMGRYMRAYKTADEWLPWVAEYERRFDEMRIELGDRMTEIWTDNLQSRDLRSMVKSAGLIYNGGAVEQAAARPEWPFPVKIDSHLSVVQP